MKIVCLQWDIKGYEQYQDNFAVVRSLAEKTAAYQPDLMVLPEMWATDFTNPQECVRFKDEILEFLKTLAKDMSLYVLGGSMAEKKFNRIANTAPLVSPKGEVLARYSKIHLFKGMEEDRQFSAGYEVATVPTLIGKLGIAICYDLRFPEMFRKMALDGADVAIVPAQFPAPRAHHWETLLRARAIENQFFTVGVNRTGAARNLEFFGKSMAVAPNGDIINMAAHKEGALMIELDLKQVQETRKDLFYLSDRRPEAYKL